MLRPLYFFVLVFLGLLLAASASAQDIPMLHFTTEDGLPGNTIYSVYRDHKGFLWVATDKGIARYNGIRFEVFTSYNGIPDNEVFFFTEDNYGRLWLGTNNGKLCYYKDDTFHSAANTPFLDIPGRNPQINNIFLQDDSSLIVSYYTDKKMLNIFKDRCRVYDFDNVKDSSAQDYIIFKRKLQNGLFELTNRSGILWVDSLYKVKNNISDKVDYATHPAAMQGQVYLINTDYIFDQDRNVIKRFKNGLNADNIVHIYYTDSVNSFLCTRNGLYVNDSLHLLIGCDVSAVTQDIVNNYWIGTVNNGLYCFRKNFLKTALYKSAYEGAVKYSYADPQNVFFSTSGNDVYRIGNKNLSRVFDYKNTFNKNGKVPGEAAFLVSGHYNYYSMFGGHFLLIRDLLARKQTVQQGVTDFFHDGLKSIDLFAGHFYLRTRGYIAVLDEKKIADRYYLHNTRAAYFDVSRHRARRIFGFAIAPDSSLWFSSIDSVFRIPQGGDEGVYQPQFTNVAFKSISFLNRRMVGVTFDNDLLVCSNINGNVVFDTITSRNCVWDKYYILDSSRMLISTNNYYRLLTVYPPSSARRPDISIIESPFVPLQPESVCSDGSKCYFFRNVSVTSIDIVSLLEKSPKPQLYFTVLKTDSKVCRILDEVVIPYSESGNIAIAFSALSFGGRNISYRYSISRNGQDDWTDLKGEEINLVNPRFGTYTIKVVATTVSGETSVPVSFTLHVLRPYWATWWFITLCICVAATIIIWIVRVRILQAVRKKEEQHEHEIKFLKLEYKALNALMNPHFIFNTLNNVQGLINRNERLAANRYLGIFARLIRQNMQNISLELIPLQKEIEIVTNYLELEKLRFKDMLHYSIIVDELVDTYAIMIPPLLIQPLVENSIKHGIFPKRSANSFIGIEIVERDGFVIISVKDNGIGIVAARQKSGAQHQSHGLENIRKRIAQLAIMQNKELSLTVSDIKDDAGNLQWTVVSIRISVS